MKIVLATGNKHKVEEINLIAKEYDIEFILPQGEFEPVEDGSTFLQNAYCKAKCASLTKGAKYFLADDSGLCVEALNNEPGIRSARYEATPEKRIAKLLKNLEGKTNRNAKFICAMVLVDIEGNIVFQVEQECKGRILEKTIGNNGFGYDPVFFVDELNKGMAQLEPNIKAKISHRAKALRIMLDWIKDNLK